MEKPVRILFASSEVAPFATYSDWGATVRKLPELLQEDGTFESRIMMPRYGLISERRNRLHEVIRLSGSKISVGDAAEVLKVKVASIPGIRLQVYFMDNVRHFKRKGIYESAKLGQFEDNIARAIFFARSVLRTTKNLGWSPNVIHAHGWLATFLPYILRTEWSSDPLFASTKSVYSTDGFSLDTILTDDQVDDLGLTSNPRLAETPIARLGFAFADGAAYGDDHEAPTADAILIDPSAEDVLDRASALYHQVLSESSLAA